MLHHELFEFDEKFRSSESFVDLRFTMDYVVAAALSVTFLTASTVKSRSVRL